jgi:hypothetical protein
MSELGPFYTDEERQTLKIMAGLGCGCKNKQLGCATCMAPMGGLGSPGMMSDAEESIFKNVLLASGSLLAGAYIIYSLPKVKSRGWQIAGWFGLTSAWMGTMTGVAGVLYHYSDSKKVEASNVAPQAAPPVVPAAANPVQGV